MKFGFSEGFSIVLLLFLFLTLINDEITTFNNEDDLFLAH